MSNRVSLVRSLTRLTVLAATLALPSLTLAQNCPLCYTQAAGSGSRVIQALRSGILIMAVPPMLICILIFVMAYKKRNHFNEDSSLESGEETGHSS